MVRQLRRPTVRHASVWIACLRLHLWAQATFPGNLLARWLQSAFGAATGAGVNLLLFARIAPRFQGWTPGGLLCLAGSAQVLSACWMGLFIQGLPRLPTCLRTADMDDLLLRPLHAQFQAACMRPDPANLLSALGGWVEVVAGLR